KVGTVVGYIRKGQGVMRVQGVRTTPPSKKELINREKFAVSQKWLSPLTDFLRIGFKDYQPTFEGFLAAKSYNHKHALECDENNVFFINPALALVSFGSQPLPLTASAICNEEQEFVFTWSTERPYAYNDYAMVVVYDSKHEDIYYHPAIAARGTGTATVKLPQFKAREVDVYLAFTSDDRKQRTNSMYLGKLAVS
ncbi:MAG TPA: DUF6266 family protein, partial [Pedobacter sp.]|nr:DUF6266 family protein [Pedobacter sp.]